MRSIQLQVTYDEGFYTATGREETEAMTYSIVAEGETWEKLKADVKEVMNAIYYDAAKPDIVLLDLVLHDEVLVA
jgi:hypothetical protein